MGKLRSKKWLEEMIIREEQELDYHRDRLYNFEEELSEVKNKNRTSEVQKR